VESKAAVASLLGRGEGGAWKTSEERMVGFVDSF
jgi:hypothetical protein